MKTLSFALVTAIVFALCSCGNSSKNNSNDKEKELLQKELELTQKELELAKQEAGMNNANNTTNTKNRKESNKTVIDIHSQPEFVVQEVFNAAILGDFSYLSGLSDPTGGCDNDVKTICSIASSTKAAQDEFVRTFKEGQIVGNAIVDGDIAKVKIKFGINGDEDEEFTLVRIGGKWYLESI